MFFAEGLVRFRAEFFVLRPRGVLAYVGVLEEKTVDNCFFKEVTETRKNEVRLCRTHVLTMFQEVKNGKNKQKLVETEKTVGFQP